MLTDFPSKLLAAKSRIISHFESLPYKVHEDGTLWEILVKKQQAWHLSKRIGFQEFLEFLLRETQLEAATFKFGKTYRPITRYMWGKVNPYAMVQTFKPSSYFTHHSALFLHGLTQINPTNIYLNFEQKLPSTSNGGLDQIAIDRAFRNKPRVTNYVTQHGDQSIYVLNGRRTDHLGVIQQTTHLGNLRFTDLERTLIDCVVRPVYSGGAEVVANAFRLARDKMDAAKLISMLRKLKYTYPYHQSIGFYMQLADYPQTTIEPLLRMPIEFKFYLENAMHSSVYIKKWKLHVPKVLANDGLKKIPRPSSPLRAAPG